AGTRAAGRGRARRPEGPGTESSSCAFRDGVALNPSRAHRRPGGENSPSRAMSVVDGNVATSRMGAAGLLGIRAHPTTTRAGAQHAPSTTPQTLTRTREIDTFVLWRSTATRSTRRSTPAWSRARKTPPGARLSVATE